jgi:hypothetical protein
MRIFVACLSGQVIVGCGDPRTPDERAEPPVEPALVAEGFAEAPGELRVDGEVRFHGGATLGTRTFAPAPARAGGTIRVRVPVAGASGSLTIGVQAPRAAGRQEARGQQSVPREQIDLRDAWVEVAAAEQVEVELPVASPWHASHAVIVAELAGDVAVAGPRRADGRAILGAVPVTPEPTRAAARRAAAISVDGRLDEAVWQEQAGASLTDSLDGEPDPTHVARAPAGSLGALEPRYGTRVAFAWDEQFLYAAADLPDVDLWSDFSAQDEPLYKQEAFELFVAATGEGRDYLEYQVSPRGVTFDAHFPRHRAGDEGWDSGWRTAVQAEGTVNDARDRDRGFTVEVAIPWAELCEKTALTCPPRAGMELRVNAFRLEREGRKRPIGLSLSPTRVPDFHAWDNAAVLVLQ